MGYLQGWLAYLVSVKMALLRLSDVEGLDKTFLNAWKSGKVCCPHENCFFKLLLFTCEGLVRHYPIKHAGDRVCDEEMKRGKSALRNLMAAETLNNIKILSQKRQEQVSYFDACLLLN